MSLGDKTTKLHKPDPILSVQGREDRIREIRQGHSPCCVFPFDGRQEATERNRRGRRREKRKELSTPRENRVGRRH